MNLGKTAVRGIVALAFSKAALAAISVITTAILARFLTPTEYGLIGMTTVVVSLFTALNSLGMDAAIISQKEVSQIELSTLYWIKAGVAFVSAVIMCACAIPVAAFYRQPELVPILCVLSLTFLTASAYQIHRSLLRKQLRFQQIGRITVLAVLGGGVASIAAAIAGLGAWSLVAQVLASDALSIALYLHAARWMPSFACDIRKSREVLNTGGNMFGASLALYVQRNIDALLSGRLLGAESLGYYSLAYRMMYQPVRQVSYLFTDVLFPAFSNVQENVDRVRRAYLRSIKATALVTFPVMTLVGIAAADLILLIFEARWLRTADLLQVMAPAGAVQSIAQIGYLLFPAMKRPQLSFRMGVANCAVVTLAVVIGSHWNVMGVATGITIATVSIWFVSQQLANRLIHSSWAEVLHALYAPLLGSACMVLGWFLLRSTGALSSLSPVLRLTCVSILSLVLYTPAILWLEYQEISSLIGLVRDRKRPARSPAPQPTETRA